jgi:chaperonin cofactor prefoldin
MNNDPKLTPEIFKAILDTSKQELESVTEDIFESIGLVVEANKKVSQFLDARISALEERLEILEKGSHDGKSN